MKRGRLAVILAVFLLWAWSVHARDDGGPKYKAPPEIIATLPKICWWLYMDNVPNTPEYNIHGCGAYTNHYCPGLVRMKEAEREKNLKQRFRLWESSKGGMEYTIQHTPPDCYLQPLARLNLQRIHSEMETLRIHLRRR